ncbi:MAG: Lon protease [Candidatus Ancillula sp.]|nr:Lon protease [Candidatus Ancillula sp.]
MSRIIVKVTLVAVLLLPSAYLIEVPGYTFDVLGKSNDKSLIKINGEDSQNNAQNGKILLLTVLSSGGPISYVPTARLLPSLLKEDQTIMPSEAVYPPTYSTNDLEDAEIQEMHTAQDSAKEAALEFIKNKTGQEYTEKVETQIDNVGGPSAGLAFALGILQKSGKFDLTKGKIVAVTGTIDQNGNVGPIGGINLKLEAAINDGASVMILPEKNYQELDTSRIPKNIRIIQVNSLEDAVNALLEA